MAEEEPGRRIKLHLDSCIDFSFLTLAFSSSESLLPLLLLLLLFDRHRQFILALTERPEKSRKELVKRRNLPEDRANRDSRECRVDSPVIHEDCTSVSGRISTSLGVPSYGLLRRMMVS